MAATAKRKRRKLDWEEVEPGIWEAGDVVIGYRVESRYAAFTIGADGMSKPVQARTLDKVLAKLTKRDGVKVDPKRLSRDGDRWSGDVGGTMVVVNLRWYAEYHNATETCRVDSGLRSFDDAAAECEEAAVEYEKQRKSVKVPKELLKSGSKRTGRR